MIPKKFHLKTYHLKRHVKYCNAAFVRRSKFQFSRKNVNFATLFRRNEEKHGDLSIWNQM